MPKPYQIFAWQKDPPFPRDCKNINDPRYDYLELIMNSAGLDRRDKKSLCYYADWVNMKITFKNYYGIDLCCEHEFTHIQMRPNGLGTYRSTFLPPPQEMEVPPGAHGINIRTGWSRRAVDLSLIHI